MLEPTLGDIWRKLLRIERALELARLHRLMDNDFQSAGHLLLGTIKEIKESDCATELGYSDDPTDI